MTFTPQQTADLSELRELWPDTPFVLIGPSALGCFLDFRWRATNDIDISVASFIAKVPRRERPPWHPSAHGQRCPRVVTARP